MGKILTIAAAIAVFAFGYYVMARFDEFQARLRGCPGPSEGVKKAYIEEREDCELILCVPSDPRVAGLLEESGFTVEKALILRDREDGGAEDPTCADICVRLW